MLAWLALLAALGGLLWVLSRAFPGEVTSGEDWAWVARGVGMVALVSAGVLNARRIKWTETAAHVGIWAGILVALAVGFTYRGELGAVAQRVRSEFSSSYPVVTAPREMVVTQDPDGGFFVMGRVNGRLVRFLVDTGASDTVLSPADAERLGVDMVALRFDQPAETANGTTHGATFTADSLSVGQIEFAGVPVLINRSPMPSSLLGMTFLRRLESFQVKGTKLYLRSRE